MEWGGRLWRPFERNNCGLYISIYTVLTLPKLRVLSGKHREKAAGKKQQGPGMQKNKKERMRV